ncbi:unnamed protein product [Rotaria socialis]|uniref:PiggyBac transposable element-derived protein 4 C-terminal zinc-finger domain-containing protein n=7 Tax=Rotaria TaxID=231623 RepID=A0A821H3U2_9BILA|nr:unnamed protein product [Rotaria socialis]
MMIKFLDKKATGDKEIYVVDLKGTAGILQVESFVRDTMESTGITRKSLNEFTPPQKRILSVSNSNIPQKLMKVQHVSSKTDYNENRQGHVQQRCVLCRSKQVRKQPTYFCRICPDKPALCYPDCFDAFHSKI